MRRLKAKSRQLDSASLLSYEELQRNNSAFSEDFIQNTKIVPVSGERLKRIEEALRKFTENDAELMELNENERLHDFAK